MEVLSPIPCTFGRVCRSNTSECNLSNILLNNIITSLRMPTKTNYILKRFRHKKNINQRMPLGTTQLSALSRDTEVK